jgi:uncharacterized protein (TIGR00661 family)
MVDELRRRHRVVVYASLDGYDLLARVYAGTDVEVRRIAGLSFIYDSAGQARTIPSTVNGVRYLAGRERHASALARALARDRTDLVVTDFEFIVPRAAEIAGIPYVSVDHQHFLTTYDLRCLPFELRLQVLIFRGCMAMACYRRQRHSVVSSFYFPPLLPNLENVTQVGVLIRPEIARAAVSDEGHLAAYFRRTLPPRVRDALRSSGVNVHVYGLGARSRDGNIVYHECDARRFADHLASCRALVCTAGNQLVGEAFFLGKPVLAIPERGLAEQRMNGFFLAASGGGICVPEHRVDCRHVRNIVSGGDAFRKNIDPRNTNGLVTALGIVESFLPAGGA